MFSELYRALREAPSFGAFLRGLFRRQRPLVFVTPSPILPLGENLSTTSDILARREFQREREALIAQSLQENRQALAQAMVEPIRRALDYQALGRRLLMVDELPQGTYANPPILQNRINELREQNRRYVSELDRVIGLLDERTRNTRVHEIMDAPRFIELSFITSSADPVGRNHMRNRKTSWIYPPIMCINKSDKKGLIRVKVLIL